jgi:hypothetical protein
MDRPHLNHRVTPRLYIIIAQLSQAVKASGR